MLPSGAQFPAHPLGQLLIWPPLACCPPKRRPYLGQPQTWPAPPSGPLQPAMARQAAEIAASQSVPTAARHSTPRHSCRLAPKRPRRIVTDAWAKRGKSEVRGTTRALLQVAQHL